MHTLATLLILTLSQVVALEAEGSNPFTHPNLEAVAEALGHPGDTQREGSEGPAATPPEGVAAGERVLGNVDKGTRRLLEPAVRAAQARLQGEGCEAVLDDFTDRDGRSLVEALQASGKSAAEYLGSLYFADGGAYRRCFDPTSRVVALTIPGERVVRLCATAFQRLDPEEREAVLIHEMLHTLGLGEKPPSPAEIDAQVRRRCFAR